MGKDLMASPYGRFFYLPYFLSRRGHEVQILLLDYSGGEPRDMHAQGIHWISVPFRPHRPGAYTTEIGRLVRESGPDWIVGFSDTYYGILAAFYGRKYGIRSCIDAYDNYESYVPWLKPLHWLWRRALRQADLVTAAGPGLLELMAVDRAGRLSVVVPMAADPVGFRPMDREECREQMGFPVNGKLIGYCGSMHKSRGVDVLFDAIDLLHSRHPDAILVHSGRVWKNVSLPSSVCSLGYIDDHLMPVLLNCMNTLVVTNRDSLFGNYSYPVKLYEAMSCKIPVAATRTHATEWILGSRGECLVPPEDPVALCKAIARSMSSAPVDYGVATDWESSCDALESALQADKPAGTIADTGVQ